MKNILITLMLIVAMTANAQNYSKMSTYVRHLASSVAIIRKAKANEAKTIENNTTEAKGLTPTLPITTHKIIAFVKAPESAVSHCCIAHQGDIHIVSATPEELSLLSEENCVVRIEANANRLTADLDSAAKCVDVKPVWQGYQPIPQAFTGAGTLVGVVDVGIDYTHPTFLSRTDGKPRFVRAWDMLDFTNDNNFISTRPFPIGRLYTSPENILAKRATADSHNENHGNHTTGIAVGSGYNTPYIGMAPDAGIYSVGCIISSNQDMIPESELDYITDTPNYLAFQRIFEYADSIGKPAVINYSISGPQDMTTDDALANEYLSRLTSTPGHIIVSSAGNNGNKRCYLPKSESQSRVGGLVYSNQKVTGIYINTRHALTLRLTDFTRSVEEGRVKDIPLDFLPGNTATTSPSGLRWAEITSLENIPELDGMTIKIYCDNDGFDPTNVGYDIGLNYTDKNFISKKIGVEIIGTQAPAEIFTQYGELINGQEYSANLKGALVGGTIGAPGAYPSVITAGSTAYQGYGGMRWNRSSIGPTLHGYTKPDVLAPGYHITSAFNSVFDESNPLTYIVTANTVYNGTLHRWVINDGTSMSAPIVTGIIALWLEAEPTLTKERIMDIIAHTSRHPDPSLSYPNNEYGYGEIDAYRGLLYLLNLNDTSGLSATQMRTAKVHPDGCGGITIEFATATTRPLSCRLFTPGGRLVRSFTIPQGTATHTIPTLDLHGIIALQIDGMGSTLVRLNP